GTSSPARPHTVRPKASGVVVPPSSRASGPSGRSGAAVGTTVVLGRVRATVRRTLGAAVGAPVVLVVVRAAVGRTLAVGDHAGKDVVVGEGADALDDGHGGLLGKLGEGRDAPRGHPGRRSTAAVPRRGPAHTRRRETLVRHPQAALGRDDAVPDP